MFNKKEKRRNKQMSKRQAIQSSVGVPADLLSYQKVPTDVHDDLIRVIPSQTSPVVVGNGLQKLTVDFPNMKTIRMGKMWLECTLTPSFTSTSGSDTWANTTPSFVPLIGSIINRWTWFVGSTTFCDNYANDLRWNLQYWLRSNPITRLDDLYMYPTGLAPATSGSGSTVAVATTVRFPLVYDPNDFGNMHCGVFPLGILPRCKVDLYFNPASNVLCYTTAPAGTLTFSYTVSNIQFWVEETSSDLIAASIAQKGLNFSYTEWFNQSTALTPNAQSVTILLPTRFRWAGKVLAVVRKVSDISNIDGVTGSTGLTKLKFFTGDLTEVTRANVRFNSILRYQENLVGSEALNYELKKLFPSAEKCDYFQNVTTNGTTNSMYALRLGNSISQEMESGINMAALTGNAQLELTWTSALGNNNYVMDCFIMHTRYCAISAGGGIDIQD
jgi:hypothetical protein